MGNFQLELLIKITTKLLILTPSLPGNPIDCVHTKDIPEDVLNTYCWIHSTYTLKSLFKKKAGEQVPYPGVGNSEGKEIDRKVYKYYQWVCFCLFFQVSHVADNTSQSPPPTPPHQPSFACFPLALLEFSQQYMAYLQLPSQNADIDACVSPKHPPSSTWMDRPPGLPPRV